MHSLAQHLQAQGRGNDSVLVHMTPREVGGLQALAMAHGGTLTTNPKTGLPEAGFLDSILPVIAGIGLNFLLPGVGTALGGALGSFLAGSAPLASGLLVGGGTAAVTGDLGKGLMAGLGAYGGASLGQGLSSLGGATSGLEAGANALNTTRDAIATPEGLGKALEMGTETGDIIGVDPNKVERFADAYQTASQPSLSNMGAGIKQAFQPGGASQLYNNLPTGTLPALGTTAAGALQDAFTPKVPSLSTPEEEEKYKSAPYRYGLASNFSGYVPPRPNPYYRPTGLGYAEGGDIMLAGGGSYDDEPIGDMPGMAAGGVPGYANRGIVTGIGNEPKALKIGEGIARDTDDDTALLGAYDAGNKRVEKNFAAANLKPIAMPKANISKLGQIKTGIAAAAGGSIGGYSDGGRMLKGPGDGMSDSIPATIGGKQPAKLADGEFVVPADVVSHIGNGSTDAGAKKLYAMMDKVRMARTGKKKQAPAVKTDKYMPA